MINKGDIVYFKRVKKTVNLKHPEAAFPKGFGYGVFLGHVPLGKPEPPPVIVLRQMAEVGFVQLDDIKEFLGEEQLQIFTEKFLDKYFGKKIEVIDAEVQAKMDAIVAEKKAAGEEVLPVPVEEQKILARPPLQLVNRHGIPVSSEPNPDGQDNPEQL